jgi:hypothetical protein
MNPFPEPGMPSAEPPPIEPVPKLIGDVPQPDAKDDENIIEIDLFDVLADEDVPPV